LDTVPLSFYTGLILFLIIINGFFTLSEMAMIVSRRPKLETMAAEQKSGAKTALTIMDEEDRLREVTQIITTFIGIIAGAISGVLYAPLLAKYVDLFAFVAPYSRVLSMILAVFGITFVLLIIGEMVPSKVALYSPETIACFTAAPIRQLMRFSRPLIIAAGYFTQAVIAFFGLSKKSEMQVTEEEIKDLIAEGTRNGTFEETEKEMVDNVFQLGDRKISGLMTPRTQLEWLDVEDSEENNLRTVLESGHSWFIVARQSLDEVLGVAVAKDLLASKLESGRLNMEIVMKTPLYVPKSTRVLPMLEMFKQSGNHIAFVIDEFGGFLGILTFADIMEEIVGDMVQQDAEGEPEITSREDGSWLMDGMLSVGELKEFLGTSSELPSEDRGHFQTLGGFVVSYLGYIPDTGESFDWAGWKFEVVDMDRVRVDKVLVTKISEDDSNNFDLIV